MKVGLQMFSVKNSFKADPYKTLEEVSKSGYKYIEMANGCADADFGCGQGIAAKELMKMTDEFGIHVIGAHISPSDLHKTSEFYKDFDQLWRIVEYYAELGAMSLTVAIDFFRSEKDLLERCECFNKIGEYCNRFGIKFLYHNHYSDFQFINNRTIIDLLLENTDHQNLNWEFEVYWAIRALLEPVQLIEKYNKRICVIHEKDYPLSAVDELNVWKSIDRTDLCNLDTFLRPLKNMSEQFTEIGYGIIKIQEIVDISNRYGFPFIIVEQDMTKYDEFKSIKMSIEKLKQMRDLDWT
jgi:sugar phosphate isomerase/epimerase